MSPGTDSFAGGPGNSLDARNSSRVTPRPWFARTSGIVILEDTGYFCREGSFIEEASIHQVNLRDPRLSAVKVASVDSVAVAFGVLSGSDTVPVTAYVAEGVDDERLWHVPLTGLEQDAPRVIVAEVATESGMALDGNGHGYGVCAGRVWRVDLESGAVHTVVDQLGGTGNYFGMAYSPARSCLYVVEATGTLWRVPLDGQQPSQVATGMGPVAYGVALQEEVDASGGTSLWAYVVGCGKVWRVNADSPVAIPVSEDVNLAVHNLGDDTTTIGFDSEGNAWITQYSLAVLWKISGLSRPASRRLVIRTPAQGGVTGLVPD